MRLFRSTLAFGSMTFLSRLAGLVRDQLQGAIFGAGVQIDAFVVAYRVPNYLRRIFAEGSMALAFVPVLNEIRERGDPAELQDFIDHMAGALLAVLLVVVGIAMLIAPWLPWIFAPGSADEPEKFALIGRMLRITFPYLLFISLMALVASILNSFGKFALPAATPILHNLCVIAAMFGLAPLFDVPAMALAWGVLAAGALQLAVLWPALGRLGLQPRFRFSRSHPEVRKVGRLMLPTLFSSSVAQLNLIVGTMFASLLATGSQSWLYYSDRLIEFPLGLFGVALGTVILPHLSRRHAAADSEGYGRTLDWAVRMALVIGIPSAVGLALLSREITAAIYQYGKFSAGDTSMVALAIAAMSLGIPAFMLSKVLAPAFFARQDTKTPMRAAIATVAINVALTIAIVTPMWLAGTPGAHAGIALATALAGIANAALLWRSLRRAGLARPQPGWPAFLLRVMLAALVMAGAVLVARSPSLAFVGGLGLHDAAVRVGVLALLVVVGVVAYAVALVAFGLRPAQLREAP